MSQMKELIIVLGCGRASQDWDTKLFVHMPSHRQAQELELLLLGTRFG